MLLYVSHTSAHAYPRCACTLYEAGVMGMESLLVKGMCVCVCVCVQGVWLLSRPTA